MIKIVLGDITEIRNIDVIVNSAKKTLLGGAGVDGAIHYKAGAELLNACRKLNGCDTGEAKLTEGYKLYAPYVIHAVGPIHYSDAWAKENNYNQDELLKNAYLNSLKLAKEHHLEKIAFSAIATGAFGYPIKEATKIALDTVVEFIRENPTFEVIFVLYLEEFYEEYINQIIKYNNITFLAERMDLPSKPIISFKESIRNYKDFIKLER